MMMFPVSAKRGIGVDELKETVKKDCDTEARAILEESAQLKLHDIVLSALSQITLYRTALSMSAAEFDKKFSQMKEFSAELIKQTADMPESERRNKAVAEAHINDVKNRLSQKVRDLFGIEYHYDIHDVLQGQGEIEDKDELQTDVEAICKSLDDTLNTIFMHREENAYKVARRINDLNKLVRKLVMMRDNK